jgi:hypothetical protein
MRTEQIRADLAGADDGDRILELNKVEYGATDTFLTHADFTWHFDCNPAGKAQVPVIRDRRGNIVSCIWIEPLRVRFDQQNHLWATGTNMVISPEYRNSFAYVILLRQFNDIIKREKIPLHFSFVSEKKFCLMRRSGSRCVCLIPLMVRPIDLRSLAGVLFPAEWQRYVVHLIGRTMLPFFFRRRSPTSDVGITVREVDQFDSSFDDFWRRVQDKYKVMAIRDRDYLSWRFRRISGRDYHILAAWAGEQMLGYIILRSYAMPGMDIGLIMDFLVDDNSIGQVAGALLLAEAEAYFRRRQTSMIATLMPSFAAEYQILREGGYVSIPQALSPRSFRFAFFIHDSNNKELKLLSPRNWFITFADRDFH